jgi:glutaminyl-tRNA synthetase
MTEHKERLEAIGLDAKVIELMQKKKSNVEKLVRILDAAGVQSCDKGQGQMFYQLSTKYPTSIETKLDLIASYIKDGKITKTNQLEGAIGFLKKTIAEKGVEAEIDSAEFEKESGVGIVVTEDDIVNCVNTLFEKNKTEIEEKKHDFNFNTIVYEARELMKWADFQIVMAKINAKKLELIGEAPKVDGRQKKGKAANKEEKKKSKEEDKKDDQEDTAGKKLSDLMPRDMQDAVNTPDQLKGHLAYTGGKIHTRFPPEPNGYLHIGHAKAMRFNFTIAKENEGNTYLRFDDTNPSKENQEFIDHIKGNVEWLGWKPFKVTASSDYF